MIILLSKYRDSNSEVLPFHLRIQSCLHRELDNKTNVPRWKCTLPPARWIHSYTYLYLKTCHAISKLNRECDHAGQWVTLDNVITLDNGCFAVASLKHGNF